MPRNQTCNLFAVRRQRWPLHCWSPRMKSVPDKCNRCQSARAEWRRRCEDLQPFSGSPRNLRERREGTNRKGGGGACLTPASPQLHDSMSRKIEQRESKVLPLMANTPWQKSLKLILPWEFGSRCLVSFFTCERQKQRRQQMSDQKSDIIRPPEPHGRRSVLLLETGLPII